MLHWGYCESHMAVYTANIIPIVNVILTMLHNVILCPNLKYNKMKCIEDEFHIKSAIPKTLKILEQNFLLLTAAALIQFMCIPGKLYQKKKLS